jgi:replicative DNA helicase
MLSPDAAAEVLEKLRPDDFYRPGHQIIFRALEAVAAAAEPVNALTVLAAAQRNRAGQEWVPDGPYLHTLIERVPVASNAGWYASRLIKRAKLRRLIMAGQQIVQQGFSADPEDADFAVERAHKLLDEATQVATISTARSVGDLIEPFLENLKPEGERAGVTTGWADVDACISRLRPGQLVTVGARPGVGKSVMMACLAHHVGVKLGLPVWVGTLEMSVPEYMARLVSSHASVTLKNLLEPEFLTDDDWRRLSKAHERLREVGTLVIDDEPGMGIPHIRSALRSMRRAGRPAALAVVDYLQLMRSAERSENRQVEVAGFSRSLKLLAKEFQVPIVVAVQLNREVERRADKKPTMADIRESGGVENDSDVVILLHREDAYDPESPRAGEIDFIVDKNRNGPRAIITAAFQGHYSRVVDMAPEPWSLSRSLRSV